LGCATFGPELLGAAVPSLAAAASRSVTAHGDASVGVVPVVGGPHVNCCGRCETGIIFGWMNKGQAVQKQRVPPRP
jgi:hypothetical protein